MKLPFEAKMFPRDGKGRKSIALRLPLTTKGLPSLAKELPCGGET